MKANRCIISGTRLENLPFGCNEDSRECQNFKNNLLNTIIKLMNKGVDEFYTDCTYGVPLWGGEIVTGLMIYNDIRLYVVFPHENQPYKYTQNWQDRFYKVHELCTDVILMYLEQDIEGNRKFLKEDENLYKKAADYMLADCGRLLFCGEPHNNYIYEKALEKNYDITIISGGTDK